MAAFDECRAKIRRANLHLRALADEVEGYDSAVALRVDLRVNEEEDDDEDGAGGEGEALIHVAEEPKAIPELEWGALIGDVVHDLQSPLDYVVNVLLAQNGSSWERGQFPIVDDATAIHADQTYRRTMSLLTPEQRAVVDRYQVYNGRQLLAVLSSLAKRERHHLLTPAPTLPGVANAFFLVEEFIDCEQIEPFRIANGYERLRADTCVATFGYRPTGPNPQVRLHTPVKSGIGLPGSPPINDVVSTLTGIRDEVERVIDECEHFVAV